jgi:hypothetical protein
MPSLLLCVSSCSERIHYETFGGNGEKTYGVLAWGVDDVTRG